MTKCIQGETLSLQDDEHAIFMQAEIKSCYKLDFDEKDEMCDKFRDFSERMRGIGENRGREGSQNVRGLFRTSSLFTICLISKNLQIRDFLAYRFERRAQHLVIFLVFSICQVHR